MLLLPLLPLMAIEPDDEAAAAAKAAEDEAAAKAAAAAKTFSQDDMNSVAAKSKRETQASLYKAWGVKDADELKTKQETYNKWVEEQKTADEKKNDALAKEKKNAADAVAKAAGFELKFAVVKAGVPIDRTPAVVALMSTVEGETTEDKIKAVLEAHPYLMAGADGKVTIPKPKGQKATVDEREAAMDKRMGI